MIKHCENFNNTIRRLKYIFKCDTKGLRSLLGLSRNRYKKWQSLSSIDITLVQKKSIEIFQYEINEELLFNSEWTLDDRISEKEAGLHYLKQLRATHPYLPAWGSDLLTANR